MKIYLSCIYFLFSFTMMRAQQSGTVQYAETRKLQFNFEGSMPPPPDMPSEITNHTVVFFTSAHSLYQNDEQLNDNRNVDEITEDGGRIMIHMDAPETKIYCDLENKKMIRQEDFMQRLFLVESDINIAGWKITGNQKMILNYPCIEAIKQDSVQNISVWFTSAIPVSTGPLKFVGLPGIVLEVNVNEGQEIIRAVSISAEVEDNKIQKPKDGKKVSEEEFNKIVEEKLKEMGLEGGPGGQIMIKIEDN